MSSLVRLWEKLSGSPHKNLNAKRVSDAADELTASARNMQEILRPYEDAPDPFTALMADLYNRRQVERMHKGSQ